MAALNFNTAPYWDDFDETKGFLKVLYRPGYAVQARELTQSQDILQNQISRFGSYVFKSGSSVLGGQLTLDTNVTYANVQATYQGNTINLNQFANTVITDTTTRTVRASVVAVSPQISGLIDPPTLMLKYLTGTTFANGANITIESSNSGPFALLANTNSQGVGSIVSIRDGVYFIDMNNISPVANTDANNVSVITNAYFVRVPSQTVILDKYDTLPSYRIGLEISDSVVTEVADSSLLDPALGASNYQAPGAARYVINATLSKRTFDSQDDTSFIELMRVTNGQLNSVQKYPVLSDINDTLARRTYDQSGSFTVTPFTITLTDSANNDIANANTQLYYSVLDSGKAYVQGYEYETVSKTILSSPKARSTISVQNNQIPTYFGNYLLVDTVKGEFNISTLPLIDIHCVQSSQVNTQSSLAYANTLLGTARLRAFEYNNSINSANGLSYVFRAHMFDVNTTSFTSNTVSSTSNTITFGSLFSSIDNAYSGLSINIPSTGDTRTITSYNGSSKTATINSIWSSNPSTGAQFKILNNILAAESIGLNSSSTFATSNANINIGSKTSSLPYAPTSITDDGFQSLIFKFPNSTIASGLTNQSYQYRYRIATNQTLQPGTPLVINLSIPGDTTATFTAAGISGSDLSTLENFLVVQNTGAGCQVVPMVSSLGRSVSSTSTTATFTMNGVDSTISNVDIYASIDTTVGAKTKILVSANTTNVVTNAGTTVGNATVYLSAGQISFVNPSTTNLMIPGIPQDIYISDVINIVAIIDSGSPSTAVTSAMIQAAVNGTTMPGSSINITNNYSFFNGQKDSYYDHATITLNPGASSPIGQVVVLVNYYSHSTSGAYFTVDSYPNYTTIPVYLSSTTGSYILRDCIDFRPRRDDLSLAYTFNNSGTILLPEPIPTEGFNVNYSYYLGRMDRIILTKDGDFKIVQGVSSLNPSAPVIPDGAMLLYNLTVPPYTFYSANVIPQMLDNKRYTMRDIGRLEKRIQALEYYTQLNALEKNAANQTITDGNGLDRPKNGILVDNFQGSSVADVLNLDYYAAIDTQNQLMRPAFKTYSIQLNSTNDLSTHYAQNGKIFTLPYTISILVDQPYASRTENLNPFNLTNWNGTLKLDPESDTWVDTNQLPAVVTNLSGDNDAWAAIGQAVNDARSPYDTVWNDWQTIWTGIDTTQTSYQGPIYQGGQAQGVYIDQWHADKGIGAWELLQPTITRTTSSTVENQVRTGIQTTLSTDTITKSIGTNIVNVSVVPYMRTRRVLFTARSMKPLTTVYPFFDNVNVQNYTCKASVITFTSNVAFDDTYGNQETIGDMGSPGAGHTGFMANSAHILMVKDNKAWVDSVGGIIAPGSTWIGFKSGRTGTVASFEHYSGFCGEISGLQYQAPVSSYVTANTITFAGSASSANNYYNGNTVCITWGDGAGSMGTITAYNGVTRTATVSPPWNVTLSDPKEQVFYSIGKLMTDNNGDLGGAFIVPDYNNLKFATGTSVFRLTDSLTNDLSSATTKAEDSYTAQGTLQTTQQQFVSTRVPVLKTQTVTDSRTVTSDPTTTQQVVGVSVVGYVDPVAQTFLIDNSIYPNGVFITSIRVCFFSKDNNIPVTLQIRPTVNGFPSSSTIIPFSEVVLNPNKIKTTTAPNLDDPSQYTEFKFDAPINLLPGTEYAVVIISNSNNYQIYSAMVGDKFLGSDRLISQPPYAGVLFKSQNSSTWTPSQGESLMFRVCKATFDTSQPMIVTFNSPATDVNVPLNSMTNTEIYMDTLYSMTSDQIMKDTTLVYGYKATSNTSRLLDSSYSPIVTNMNYNFSDRKVLLPSGNSFYLQATGVSNNQDISPVIDTERYSILAISNQINNGGITNSSITIVSSGRGYNIANTNIITVSGGNGSGAQLAIGSVDPNGNITSVYVKPNGSGGGYTQSPNVSITTSGYSVPATALISIAGEDKPSGGNFTTRYISRKVTLASGMDAGDLNVTFDANKPLGTQIYVYYKIMSGEDNDVFENKPWVLMSLDGTDSFATGSNDFTEYTYVGSVDQYGNPIRSISYSTFNTFKYYAIKIVESSNNPAIVPLVRDLRIIAMPASI